MKSITQLSKLINCNAQLLNNVLVERGIFVKVEFGIGDGFIEDELFDSIVSVYNSNMDSLLLHQQIIEMKSPYVPVCNKPCVYFLFDRTELVYIGQSVQLLGRLQQHIQDRKIFDEVSYVFVNQKQLLFIESFYIYRHKPKHNCVTDKSEAFVNLLIRNAYL